MVSAIVLGGSRGIGKAISESLKTINIDVFAASKNDGCVLHHDARIGSSKPNKVQLILGQSS